MPISFQAVNEPILHYAPGSTERAALQSELEIQQSLVRRIPALVGGERIYSARTVPVTAPHRHRQQLAELHLATADTVAAAIDSALAAAPAWAAWTLEQRAAVFLKAADLLAGPWRQRLNAATMLGQGKTAVQAEIDAACELIDFLRFNVQFAFEIAQGQPLNAPGVRNRLEYRPLEGFVYAVTPFNFTAIGGNLAIAPALMGNVVLWKPAATAALSNWLFMELLEEAGLPGGVINFVPGDAVEVSAAALAHPALAGVHFTGSTAVFDGMWGEVGRRIASYRAYPRLIGETGGKDFVLAHPSADVETLAVGLLRGAFEYQGQKCSAASRAYVPASLWPAVEQRLCDMVATIAMGDVTDFGNFMGAVIDRRAFDRIAGHIAAASQDSAARIVAGGQVDDSIGYFIAPTVIVVEDPLHTLMQTELFGPVLSIYVYPDDTWDTVLELVDRTSPYALTGAVFARDRTAVHAATHALRFAAGNFYINDKPTGAVVGQQPFGGARRSGTNDKAGSPLNLLRWVSPRTVKETSAPPVGYDYPHMA